jgi:rsbT co-antagonist protein RsbR
MIQQRHSKNSWSLKKVGFFDIGIIVDVMVAERERIINQQQEAIRELSTPVLQVRDRLLILPIIGMIDTFRAKQLTESLLHAIRANRAKVAVMDITGVAAVDSKVANHLVQTVAAARLMGAIVIVTGLSADVAQALLGVDLRSITTVGDLQGGLELAERLLDGKPAPSVAGA